jgi:SAM-dependent methyltransferase
MSESTTQTPLPAATLAQSTRMDLAGLDECVKQLALYFDAYALSIDAKRKFTGGYHSEIQRLYRYYIPEGASVLEIGCGTGELLAALRPSRGVGVDLSAEMVRIASERHPHCQFKHSAFESLSPDVCGGAFDYIVISDTLAFVYDILAFFKALKPYCHARTRIILNTHSRLWQPLLSLTEMLKLKHKQPVINWVTVEDTANLFNLAGFEVISRDTRMLMPARIPLVARFLNSVCAPFFPFRPFCLTNWMVARLPQAPAAEKGERPSVSIVVPCRNEAGNIPQVLSRLPDLGAKTELILVEGHSKDGTLEACEKLKTDNPQFDISVYQQTGKGKKDAVWLGFDKAKGDVLIILDADLTVQPEDLPAFYEAIASGRVEFVNGCRLVYPMEGQAMRFLNLVANKFFSLAFSSLIGQNVKDTLCGTKVLLRSDYERLKAGRAYFGDFDPFGDFDLLFGSAKLSLKIADLPIRYRARVYGETQISRFRHGWMLLKMCGVGLIRLRMR